MSFLQTGLRQTGGLQWERLVKHGGHFQECLAIHPQLMASKWIHGPLHLIGLISEQ